MHVENDLHNLISESKAPKRPNLSRDKPKRPSFAPTPAPEFTYDDYVSLKSDNSPLASTNPKLFQKTKKLLHQNMQLIAEVDSLSKKLVKFLTMQASSTDP